ncbi:MAG: ParB/RepB/Spo0J family partition protein [Oligoflexia bacterium]|nr:ParB/RepB/Spo0J family partition protein [Oligoflexia bacterium]
MAITEDTKKDEPASKIKTRQGSGYLKQLYSTARTTAGTTHTHLKNQTTILVNFIPTEKVDASELQVRVHFDDSEIEALAHSIKEHGVLQPILVVQDGDRYKVIAGERRLRAAKRAGQDRIPARVLSTDDKATHEIALRENLDRVDLHPIEEGEGYLSLLEAQAYTSHDSIAKSFGKPKSRITECIGFTKLPETTKQELMLRGIKNRALLRDLLTTPVEQHLTKITEAAGKEELLAQAEAARKPVASTEEKKAKELKPFTYSFDNKSLNVPVFKWKAGEGTAKLQAYADSIKKLLEQIEDRLTSP